MRSRLVPVFARLGTARNAGSIAPAMSTPRRVAIDSPAAGLVPRVCLVVRARYNRHQR